MPDRPRKVRTLLGTLACLLLLIHVAIALVIVAWPDASRRSRVLGFYRRFVVLGPFFQESRIISTQHLLVSQYEKEAWSEGTDFACLAVAGKAGGKYEALQRQSFENFLADRAARAKRRDAHSLAVRELEGYLRSRPAFNRADSIAVAFIRQSAIGTEVHIDTIYQYKFKR